MTVFGTTGEGTSLGDESRTRTLDAMRRDGLIVDRPQQVRLAGLVQLHVRGRIVDELQHLVGLAAYLSPLAPLYCLPLQDRGGQVLAGDRLVGRHRWAVRGTGVDQFNIQLGYLF